MMKARMGTHLIATVMALSLAAGHSAAAVPLAGAAPEADDARSVAAGQGRGFWRTFGAAEGLLVDPGSIYDMLEDRDGNLWITGWNFISRYDGEEFVNFTAADGLPEWGFPVVFEDSKGGI